MAKIKLCTNQITRHNKNLVLRNAVIDMLRDNSELSTTSINILKAAIVKVFDSNAGMETLNTIDSIRLRGVYILIQNTISALKVQVPVNEFITLRNLADEYLEVIESIQQRNEDELKLLGL